MKNLVKGLASLILIAALVMGISVISQAEEISYKCGKNSTWSYDTTSKTLTISGEGSVYYNEAWEDINPEKVVIKKGITKIAYDTFYGMKSIKKVSIPDTVTKIGSWAFGYTGLKEVTIGANVKSVEDAAFAYCKSLESVTWNAKKIPDSAFYRCKKLTKIKINDDLKSIGSDAFGYTKITEFNMPDSVKNVSSGAFSNCKKLEKLTFSKSIEVIPHDVANNTPKLKTVVIKAGTKKIAKEAFYNCGAREIQLPNTIEIIGRLAFDNAENLERIKIPEKVTKVKDNAFEGCKSLENVEFAGKVKAIGECAFKDCKSLKEITVPGSVNTIEYKAFENAGCEKITIEDGVSEIDYWAFNNCDKLTTISIGDTVRTIGENAFADCSSLTSINVSANNPNFSSKDGCLLNKSGWKLIVVPAGKKGVYEVPAGVVSIEATAFYGCDWITAFAANPKSGYTAEDGILYNSAKTVLVSCPSGRTGTITIPSTVKHIGESAFQHSKASNIIIPNSVTSMGYCAFEYCENLKSITIPGSVKKISNAAFWECTKLKKVTIEKGVKRIKRNAFHGCVKLKKIVIPSTVKSIAKSAFSDCGDLKFYCKKSSAAMSYAVRRYYIDYKVI